MFTLLLLMARWGYGTFGWSFEDLAVYRRAGAAILRGASPYATADGFLPFTYPPFAALSFAPLQLIGAAGSAAVLTTLSGLGLYCVVALCGRELGLTSQYTILLGLLCCALEPVLRTFRLGQLNIVLVALVLIDCLVTPPRYRGVLVGVAAGLKLTPAIFIGWFLLRRDWKAAGLSAASGSATVLLSALVSPQPTWQFWTRFWYDPGHIGGVAYVDNQSLYGVLVRLLRTEHPAGIVVFAVDVITLALGAFAASRHAAADRQLTGLAVVGLTGLLVSPISWSHHWIWLIPALLVLGDQRRWCTLALGAGISYLAPQWWTPAGNLREFHSSWDQQLLCAALPLWGLLFLGRMSMKARRTRPATAERAIPRFRMPGHAESGDSDRPPV